VSGLPEAAAQPPCEDPVDGAFGDRQADAPAEQDGGSVGFARVPDLTGRHD